MKTKISSAGFTLIELMISLAISSLLLGAIFSFFSSNLSTQKNVLQELNLNRETRLALDLISSEIKRAGFSPANITPDLDVSQATISSDKKCILFNYNNKTATIASDKAISGFRWFSSSPISVLQMRNKAAGTCDDADSVNWENITNSKTINITAFSVKNSTSDPSKIDITFTAEASSKTKIKAEQFSIYMPNIKKVNI
jgi:prepilin peptidase dependent protein B